MRKTTKTAARTAAAKNAKAVENKIEQTGKAAEIKAVEVKATEVKAEAVKAAEVKAEEKPAEEKAVKPVKAAAKKTALKEEVVLQWYGKEISKDEIMKQVKEIWTKQMKNKVGDMNSITLYLKPEENRAYYVINGDVTGSIEL